MTQGSSPPLACRYGLSMSALSPRQFKWPGLLWMKLPLKEFLPLAPGPRLRAHGLRPDGR
jgi:hypothetical protein